MLVRLVSMRHTIGALLIAGSSDVRRIGGELGRLLYGPCPSGPDVRKPDLHWLALTRYNPSELHMLVMVHSYHDDAELGSP